MHARVVLGVGKRVLFKEVSSFQVCPHRGFHCIPELGVSGAALGHTGLFYGGARPQ